LAAGPGEAAAEPWCWRGLAEHVQGEVGNALGFYGKALAAAPRYAPALLLRALAYARQGETAKATEDLARAIQVDRNWGWSYVEGGFAGVDAGVRTGLLKDLNALSKLNARAGWPIWMRGVLLHRKGDLADARTEYARAQELLAGAPMLAADLTQLALDRGDAKEAREAAERFLKLAPRSPFAGWAAETARKR
ncbi:MAG: tetratricopeptide repeat protein, partial [Planctomycetes bacterium]|nr:tetratricopeptide repeat protein [Planctomycetota bacterium]